MAAIVAHSVCNFMSLPDPVGAVKRAQLRLGLFGQLLAVAAHLAGLLLWIYFLYPATDPRKFSNHMDAASQLKGRVSFDSLEPFISRCLREDSPVEQTDLNELISLAAYLDGTYFILRHLHTRLKTAKRDEKAKPILFYENALSVMDLLLCPARKPCGILGQPIKPKTELARHVRLSYLRYLFTQVWIQFLDNQISDELILKAIRMLGDDRLSRLSETRLLADYVIPIFDVPPHSDLALSTEASVPPTWSRAVSRTMLGLVHKGGLHYPRLYLRLYELLDDSLLECPEVDRFLDDLDIYLSSLHLAASVVAAFAKRLAQLALLSPMRLTPALLLLIRNTLQRHLKCSVLVNRQNRPNLTVNSSKQPTPLSSSDPYQWDPRNLESCGALESSLWEVASLIHHYSPAVSSLAYDICNPNPANAATWEGLSPSDLIRQQDSELKRCVDNIHQSLLSLTRSNVSIPELPMLEGWLS
ncbi:Nucleolar complex protein 4 [Paragonimus heterotremus]|uniref:Nucleolar complex protein 4 n=1 Tax=Paragonimus heterotremus TaxID=100268 RepID=A0A8J4WZZ1_9TREM|nr:Nucleolar complex protein 4 [Paragonimus heterotremus]